MYFSPYTATASVLVISATITKSSIQHTIHIMIYKYYLYDAIILIKIGLVVNKTISTDSMNEALSISNLNEIVRVTTN